MTAVIHFLAAITMVVLYGAYCVWRAWRRMPSPKASDERIDEHLQTICPEYKRRRTEVMKEVQ